MNQIVRRIHSPVEVVADARPYRLGQVGQAIAVAALVALLLGAKALANWANELPFSAVSDFVLYLAEFWQDQATALGLTRYADAVRTLLHLLEALR